MAMRMQGIMVAVVLGATSLAGQVPAGGVAVSLPAGTKIKAELRTKLDTGSAKVGEAVEAEVRSDVKVQEKKVLPKGSRLIGKVLAVSPAESDKSPSSITFAFTAVEIKHGGTMSLDATLTGLQRPYTPPNVETPPMPVPGGEGTNPGMINQGGMQGTMGVPPVTGMPNMSNGKPGGLLAQNRITPLHVATSGNKIRISSTGDIVLDSGTDLELKVLAAGGGQ